jgi:hypothetical protein
MSECISSLCATGVARTGYRIKKRKEAKANQNSCRAIDDNNNNNNSAPNNVLPSNNRFRFRERAVKVGRISKSMHNMCETF